jgi:hypothetical protein
MIERDNAVGLRTGAREQRLERDQACRSLKVARQCHGAKVFLDVRS